MPEDEGVKFVTAVIKFFENEFCFEPGIQLIIYLLHFTGCERKQRSKKQRHQTSDFTDPNHGINNDFRNKNIFLIAKKYSGKLCNIQRKKEKEEGKSTSANQQQADHKVVIVKMMRNLNIFVQEINLFIKIYFAIEDVAQGFGPVG